MSKLLAQALRRQGSLRPEVNGRLRAERRLKGIHIMSPTGWEAPLANAAIRFAQQQGWIEKLKDAAFARKHPVLVLGSTGVGKTNFLESLRTFVPQAIDAVNRTEVASREKIKIDKDIFIFEDTPGQKLHRQRRMNAILGAAGSDGLGVINLTSWGLHEYGFNQGDAILDGKPNPEWLKRRKKDEIDAISEWGPLIMASSAKWFFTVVTKSDLWWPDRELVERHYTNGPYGKELDNFDIKNRSTFGYSSVRHPFYGIAPTAGDFSDDNKRTLQQRLLQELLKAVAQG